MSPTRLPFAFGMNEFTTQPWSFEEDVRRYVECGVDAIELCEQKLDPERVQEQMAVLTASPLTISAVQPLVRTFFSSHMQPEPHGVEARVARLTQSITTLAPYALGASFIVNTGAPADGNMAGAIATVVRELRVLGDLAEQHGVRIALEPLNPTAMNLESTIWTTRQALDILDEVDHPAVGLCFDLWNVWQEAELAQMIARAGKRLFVLQVSDWRTPQSGQDRLIPGQGDIPIGSLLHRVFEAGFSGACTVEIFSSHVRDSIYTRDLTQVIAESRQGIENTWSKR